ncbi:MAG: protein kinase, partial [Comamonadaceae bacterium]|nr:protein kinase [Comamonadaceae bacterium]
HTDGSPFIAMELLKGQDLHEGDAPGRAACASSARSRSIVQVLAGLGHAHQAGIVHRDIKPANIFVHGRRLGEDHGLRRGAPDAGLDDRHRQRRGDRRTTCRPSRSRASKVDGRSDLFSVGCMLFELVTGRRPFHSDNLMAIFYKITHEEPNFDLDPAGRRATTPSCRS